MKFIGVKMIDAVIMSSDTAKKKGYKIGNVNEPADGFEVTYPDGYKSWCPADVFSKEYFKIEDETGTKISKEDVDRMIVRREPKKLGDKTVLVMDTTITGFDTVATSACVDPNNFKLDVGAAIARKDIDDKIWGHLGFVLQWAKNGLDYEGKNVYYNIPAHVKRMMDEYGELNDKINKLNAFINNSNFNVLIAEDEQCRLKSQFKAMIEYSDILYSRIVAAGYGLSRS